MTERRGAQHFVPSEQLKFARTDPTRGVPFYEPPTLRSVARKALRILGAVLLATLVAAVCSVTVEKAFAGEPRVVPSAVTGA